MDNFTVICFVELMIMRIVSGVYSEALYICVENVVLKHEHVDGDG